MSDDVRSRALRAQGDLALAMGRLDEAELAYREALGLAESPTVEGEIWTSVAWLSQRRDEHPAAEQALTTAIAAFARAGEPARQSTALQSRATLRWGRAHERLHGHHGHHHGASACEPAPGHDPRPHEATITEDLSGALADMDEAVRIARAAGAARAEATALAARASLLRFVATERPALVAADAQDRARDDLDAAIDAFVRGADLAGAVLLCCAEVERARRADDRAAAHMYVTRANEIAPTTAPPVRARATVALAELLAEDGRLDEARAAAADALAELGGLPDPGLRRRIQALLDA